MAPSTSTRFSPADGQLRANRAVWQFMMMMTAKMGEKDSREEIIKAFRLFGMLHLSKSACLHLRMFELRLRARTTVSRVGVQMTTRPAESHSRI